MIIEFVDHTHPVIPSNTLATLATLDTEAAGSDLKRRGEVCGEVCVLHFFNAEENQESRTLL